MLVVTLNPAIDRTLFVDRLTLGAEMRVKAVRSVDGGKGVNLARALKGLGIVGRSLTLKDAVPSVDVRINTTVVDAGGRYTRFIEPGPHLSTKDLAGIKRYFLEQLDGVRILVLCGSIPPGAPADIYSGLILAALRKGLRTVLDSSGAALEKGVTARPWCIKPNRQEAEALLGFKIGSVRAVRKALQMLARYGMTRVLLSLAEEGLAGFDGEDMFLARGPRRTGLTVGCGDASLAGFLAADIGGAGFREALRSGAAAGMANVGVDVPGGITRVRTLAGQKKIMMERI